MTPLPPGKVLMGEPEGTVVKRVDSSVDGAAGWSQMVREVSCVYEMTEQGATRMGKAYIRVYEGVSVH